MSFSPSEPAPASLCECVRDRYHASRKTGAHDDSIWAVAWPTEDKLITGSIDESVKVSLCFGLEMSSRTFAGRQQKCCFPTAGNRQTQRPTDGLVLSVVHSFCSSLPLCLAQVWKPAVERMTDQPPVEVISQLPGHFLGVVSVSASNDGRLCAVSSLDGRVTVRMRSNVCVGFVLPRGLESTPFEVGVDAWLMLLAATKTYMRVLQENRRLHAAARCKV